MRTFCFAMTTLARVIATGLLHDVAITEYRVGLLLCCTMWQSLSTVLAFSSAVYSCLLAGCMDACGRLRLAGKVRTSYAITHGHAVIYQHQWIGFRFRRTPSTHVVCKSKSTMLVGIKIIMVGVMLRHSSDGSKPNLRFRQRHTQGRVMFGICSITLVLKYSRKSGKDSQTKSPHFLG